MAQQSRYRLSAPTLEDMKRALSRAVGQAAASAAIGHALAAHGYSEHDVQGSVLRLSELAQTIAGDEGLISVVGLSMSIRCRTYLAVGASVVH